MVKGGQCIETITVVDGVERIHTQFINSVRIAINKQGVTFTGNLHDIAWKIEKYKIEQYYGGEFRPTSSQLKSNQ